MSEERVPAYSVLPAWKRDLSLFWAYFKIAALVVGGGYAILAAARREFVTRKEWLTEDEMVDMMTVTQTVPGIIACNTAAYIGWKIDGVRGAASAVLGAVCPSFLIILLIASGMTFLADFFASPPVRGAFRAVTAAIAAMVAVTGMKMRRKTVAGPEGVVIALVCFAAITVIRISPPYMIAFAVISGIAFEACRRAGRNTEDEK